jgi:hypothetical protein
LNKIKTKIPKINPQNAEPIPKIEHLKHCIKKSIKQLHVLLHRKATATLWLMVANRAIPANATIKICGNDISRLTSVAANSPIKI